MISTFIQTFHLAIICFLLDCFVCFLNKTPLLFFTPLFFLDFLLTLFQTLKEAKEGKKIKGPAEYLNVLGDSSFDILASGPKDAKDAKAFSDDHQHLLSWYRFRALYLVEK